jgi:hypothetical protein
MFATKRDIETLNQKDFLEAVKAAFPRIDWDKAYEEFRATIFDHQATIGV